MLGWLLPRGQGMALVCWGPPDVGMVSRYRWLSGAGLLVCPLIAVVSEESVTFEPTERCAGEALLARLEWERRKADGTGIGDPPGRDQCRGVSEL